MAARAPVEQLAALSDDQAAAAIRTAAADVLAAVQVWRVRAMLAGVGHRTRRARRGRRRRQRAGRSVRRCRAGAVVDAVGPLVRTWWPAGIEVTLAALRDALARPRLAGQCRALLPHLGWITARERPVGWQHHPG